MKIPIPPLTVQLAAARTLHGLNLAEQRYHDVVEAIRAVKDRELADLANRLTADAGAEEGLR